MGGSPGLVVMGGDSWPKGCGFESQHHILDGHFSPLLGQSHNNTLSKLVTNVISYDARIDANNMITKIDTYNDIIDTYMMP